MRIVFMGTPDFAVSALEAIVNSGHEVAAVVTQPDKPRGRGKAVLMPPVKEKALELGIPVCQPLKVREESFMIQLRAFAPQIIVVVAFGQILPKQVLELPEYGCVNIHASLLPKYRGAAPIQWAVIDGEKETGVTTMKMDVGLDTGDMLEQVKITLDEKETGGSLFHKLSVLGGELILSTLKKIENGSVMPVPQKDEGSSYAKMLDKSLGNIDWNRDAVSIERLVRGLNPWPSAYTTWKGSMIKIWSAAVLEGAETKEGLPGQVIEVTKHTLLIQTGSGVLSVKELQLQGKKRMDIESFLRGYQIEPGTVFERSS